MPLVALLVSGAARADLDADLGALERAWGRAATRLTRLEPRLVQRGEVVAVRLPAHALDVSRDDCSTVAVIGAPSAQFVLRFAPLAGGPAWPNGESPETSSAGAAQLVRCGVRKSMLSRLLIEMRSPRGVLEVVVVEGPKPASALSRSLPLRDPGPSAPFGRVGPRPTAAPTATRAAGALERQRREGAARVARAEARALRDGTSESRLHLDPGCHELVVLSPDPGADPEPRDIDAELWALPSGRSLSRDHTVSLDATLPVCVGERTSARLRIAGAEPSALITVVHATWPLSEALPERWGPEPRARLAATLGRHWLRSVTEPPVYESLGAGGVTLLPLPVTPGRCYLLALAGLRGQMIGVAASASFGTRRVQNHSGLGGDGVAVAFCAVDDTATFEIEARGTGLLWLGALFNVSGAELGELR